ncbi:hypothetical protein ACA910_002194 [Epithemia clementina (nom. ined.)]
MNRSFEFGVTGNRQQQQQQQQLLQDGGGGGGGGAYLFQASNNIGTNNNSNRFGLDRHSFLLVAPPPPERTAPSMPTTTTTSAAAAAAVAAAAAAAASAAAAPRPPISTDASSQLHPDDISQLPALRARVRSYVDGVIRSNNSILPRHETLAYLEAMAKDPELVYEESDPLQFVRYCKYDLWAGAKRLCMYWTERRRLFGPQRAFLPLTLTGTGALTPEDVHNLHAGYPAILPDTVTGRKCVLIDRNNWIRTATDDSKLRAWFYVNCIMAKDEFSQIEGLLALIVMITPRDREIDWNFVRRLTYLGTHVFPIRVCAHYLSKPNRRKYTMATQLTKTALQLTESLFRQKSDAAEPSLNFHIETEANQILNELASFGLTKKSIPLVFGGEWKIQDWFVWCQERKEWEEVVYKNRLLKKPPAGDNNSSSGLPATTAATRIGVATMTAAGQSGAAIINASNFVNFAALRESMVMNQPAHLQQPQQQQQPQHYQLQKREQQPQEEQQESEQQRQELVRMENVLRSRRERQRRRIEFDTLRQESFQLSLDNERLTVEQNRLNQLLAKAERLVSEQHQHQQEQGQKQQQGMQEC